MCFSAPKISIPETPPPAQYQAMQAPKDMMAETGNRDFRKRRGFWSTVVTSAQGLAKPPSVTGVTGAG